MNNFETSDFEKVAQYIKPLLESGYQVRITPDCELVYSVDFVRPEYGEGSFELLTEEFDKDNCSIFRLHGEKIEYVCEEEGHETL